MTLQDAVTQYLASGGKVTEVPGFTGIKPMPPRVDAPEKRTEAAKKTKGEDRTAGWYTMIELAGELGYISRNSVRALQAKGLIPKACGQRGGKDIWSPEVVQETVTRMAEYKKQRKLKTLMRKAISAEAESAKAIRAKVVSYAKKQRDKLELAQEWKELDNAAP